MSSRYIISLSLEINYSKENIIKILQKGIDLDISFYTYIWGEMVVKRPPIDNLEGAAQAIIQGDENNLHCLNLKIKDSFLLLHFFNNAGKISLMLNNFSYLFLKTFVNGDEDIDIGNYAKVMVDLAEDYKILEMRIEKI